MTKKKSATKWQIYTAADPTVERIFPSLAKEIGLNESIVLMQIAFWIKTSNNVVNDTYWTYQSMTEMQEKAFPYWSVDTIRRIVHKLQKAGYILVGQHNKRKGDNTQWYALEPDKLSTLKSIIVQPIEAETSTPSLQLASMAYSQIASTPLQSASTVTRDYSTENKEKDISPSGVDVSGKKSRAPHKNASWHDALLRCFKLNPQTVTRTADRTYWTAAADFASINFPIERIPEFHRWCINQNWPSFTVMAMAKHAGEWLVKNKVKNNIVELDPALDLSIQQPVIPMMIARRKVVPNE